MGVKLIWITPNAEELISYMARVSNTKTQISGENSDRLIGYLIRNKHWSPFEMASACFEIETTRDIARQILRHRSFSFQEFSQRYAKVGDLPKAPLREARLQDTKNRQNSIETTDEVLQNQWERYQKFALKHAETAYNWAIVNGIAKEQARAVLPEGLTMSRMYMSGTIRSWMHYTHLRTEVSTQKEHRLIAYPIGEILAAHLPATMQALAENS